MIHITRSKITQFTRCVIDSGDNQMNKLVRSIAGLFIGVAVCSHAAMALDIVVVHSGS